MNLSLNRIVFYHPPNPFGRGYAQRYVAIDLELKTWMAFFWQNELGFVVDKHKMPSSFPSGDIFGPVSLRALLLDSKKLPNLGAAPVASWLLARLMQLTNEGLGFERNDRLYNDGGGYYLNFITFSRNMTPLAFFNVHGTSEECSCWGQCTAGFLSTKLLATFVDALVVNVDDLMQCRLVYRDTDPSNLDKRRIVDRASWVGMELRTWLQNKIRRTIDERLLGRPGTGRFTVNEREAIQERLNKLVADAHSKIDELVVASWNRIAEQRVRP